MIVCKNCVNLTTNLVISHNLISAGYSYTIVGLHSYFFSHL